MTTRTKPQKSATFHHHHEPRQCPMCIAAAFGQALGEAYVKCHLADILVSREPRETLGERVAKHRAKRS